MKSTKCYKCNAIHFRETNLGKTNAWNNDYCNQSLVDSLSSMMSWDEFISSQRHNPERLIGVHNNTYMSKQLNSYKGDNNFKQQMVTAIIAYKENDRIVKGHYWEDGRGCNIGCGEYAVCQILGHEFEDRRHKKLAEELEVPEAIFHLGDTIFEKLPEDAANQFVVDFYQAIPVGKDLKNVVIDMKIALLSDPQFGSRQYAFDDGKAAIDVILELLNRSKTDDVSDQEWAAAAAAADSAADSARAAAAVAWSSANSAAAAARLAAAVARAAAAATEEAAAVVAERATRSAGSAASYKGMAKKLIELLSNATTPSV